MRWLSMETKRRSEDFETPLSKAVYLTHSMIEKMHSAGVKTGIFGLHDFGRKRINLHIIKDYEAPFDVKKLESLHAMYFGGSRMGAGIRHLGKKLEMSYPGMNHFILILQDNGSRYLAKGLENALKQLVPRCKSCKHRCRFEPQIPKIRSHYDDPINIFFPAYYEYEDINNAILSLPNVYPFFVMLDAGCQSNLLDTSIGHENWASFLSTNDLYFVEHKIKELFHKIIL